MRAVCPIVVLSLALAACSGHKVHRDDAADAVKRLPPEDMVKIPAGAYRIRVLNYRNDGVCTPEVAGSPEETTDQAWPDRTVQMEAFEIDKDVVGTGDYCECAGEHACPEARQIMIDSKQREDDYCDAGFRRPAEVTARAAAAYCAWRSVRVPTFTEWQAAMRGHDGVYPKCDVAIGPKQDCRFTSPTGAQVRPDLYEWTRSQECFSQYHGATATAIMTARVYTGDHFGVPGQTEHENDVATFRCVRDAIIPPT
jgi:hypothetical protein